MDIYREIVLTYQSFLFLFAACIPGDIHLCGEGKISKTDLMTIEAEDFQGSRVLNEETQV